MDAFEPDLTMWDPWGPEEVARRLGDIDVPWYVAAGWAIDLFLGSVRRKHEDIEIAVPRSRRAEVLDALKGFEFFAAGVPRSGFVTALPVAEARDSDSHQTWVREPASGLWRLDVFSEPSEGETWICRRNSQIRMPYERLIERTDEGIPYGRPEVVLLFKAKAARSKDEDDFAAVLPQLEGQRRRWLADALELVHPGHRWLARLSEEQSDADAAMEPERPEWQRFRHPGFALEFSYPTVTPQGQDVERDEEQFRHYARVHLSSSDRRELYLEVVKFHDLAPEDEYIHHRPYLEQRFGADSITVLAEARLHGRPAWTYGFQWDEGERAMQRSVLLFEVAGSTYRLIYDPLSSLNEEVLATLTFADGAA